MCYRVLPCVTVCYRVLPPALPCVIARVTVCYCALLCVITACVTVLYCLLPLGYVPCVFAVRVATVCYRALPCVKPCVLQLVRVTVCLFCVSRTLSGITPTTQTRLVLPEVWTGIDPDDHPADPDRWSSGPPHSNPTNPTDPTTETRLQPDLEDQIYPANLIMRGGGGLITNKAPCEKMNGT